MAAIPVQSFRRPLAACCVALVCTLALFAMSTARAQDDTAPKVTISAAYTEELTRQATFIGRGEAHEKTDLIAQVTGSLVEIVVADGAQVNQGDLIFRIEPDTYEAEVAAQQAAVQRAEANVNLAHLELARKTELLQRDTISQSEVDFAEADSKVAEADLASAKAALQQAELNLARTEIKAPFEGRIGRTNVSPGALVGPSSGVLATIVRDSPMYVTFSLSEPQLLTVLSQLDVGIAELVASGKSPSVFVQLPDGTLVEEAGRLVFLDNRIDPTTGTIAVRAEFENERQLILDGGFVSVVIEALEPTLSVLIPQNAVQRDQRGDFVLVVTDQQLVEQRYVRLGPQEGTEVVVSDGLREGESIIVEGLQRVRPGVAVDAVLSGTAIGDAGGN